MVAHAGPTVLRRHIAQTLVRLRLAAGFERKDVASFVGRSLGHVRHLETMVHLPNQSEARDLLTHYGAAERLPSFLGMVKAAREGKDWWEDFPGRPSWLELLLSAESAAEQIDSYDTMAVTGLFHTPGYAEAIIRTGAPHLTDDEVQQRIELRMARQDVLTRQPNPPMVQCVMDEAVLHHLTPDPAVLAEQLVHLVKLAELPNVSIQVAEFGSTAWLDGVSGTFTVLTNGPEFEDDPGLAYTETLVSGTYIEDAEQIERCRKTFASVQRKACSPEDSLAILAQRAEEISR